MASTRVRASLWGYSSGGEIGAHVGKRDGASFQAAYDRQLHGGRREAFPTLFATESSRVRSNNRRINNARSPSLSHLSHFDPQLGDSSRFGQRGESLVEESSSFGKRESLGVAEESFPRSGVEGETQNSLVLFGERHGAGVESAEQNRDLLGDGSSFPWRDGRVNGWPGHARDRPDGERGAKLGHHRIESRGKLPERGLDAFCS